MVDDADEPQHFDCRAGRSAVRVRVYVQNVQRAGRPLLVFTHGGGFSWGTLDDYDQICRNLMVATDGVVISVDYRLAPAHPFPAGLNDVYEAVLWAATEKETLAGPNARLILAGDSAGGCLTAGVAQKLRRETNIQADGQLLIYPMIEHHVRTPAAFHEVAKRFPPSFEDIRGAWEQYLSSPADAALPYAVPSRAPDLRGLPPALVLTAENDPLRFEAEAYARLLEGAGVPVRTQCYADVRHSFLGETPNAPRVRDAMRDIGEWIVTLAVRRGATSDAPLRSGPLLPTSCPST